LNFRQLQFFVAIVEEGSLSKAALKVRVAQPSLSQHVRQLEAEMNTQLLFRGPKGVEPTEAGRTLLHHARVILGHIDVARDAIVSSQKQPAGNVRFGIPGTVANVLALPLVEEIRSRYPLIRLSLAEAMSGDILGWLRDGRVDVGIIYRTADAQLISSTHLLTEELWLIAPSRKNLQTVDTPEITLEDLAKLDLILPTSAHGLRTLIDDFAIKNNICLEPRIEMDSATQLKLLVEKGIGFTILPLISVSQEIVRGALKAVRIVNPTPYRKLFLSHSAERPLSNAAVAVQRVTTTLIRKLTEAGTWPAELP
jgi:LysR family nitrogen assimilation transcriptional regulator